jgi:cbb3-type cytochrome c oxidase subunit III
MNDRRRICFCLGASLLVVAQLLTAQSKPLSSADATELAAGKRIFDAQCAWCHGTDGSGGTGPSLQRSDLRHAGSDADLVSIVRNGIAGTEMPGFQWSLTDTMTGRTAAYVRSLGRRAAEPVRGDATRGAAIYEAKGCQTCHVMAGRGTTLGPELTAIGALRGPVYSPARTKATCSPSTQRPATLVAVPDRRSDARESDVLLG